MHCAYRASGGCNDRVFHFHRFEDQKRCPLGDSVTGLDQHRHDRARHRRGQVPASMLVVGRVRQRIDQRESVQLSVDEHITLVSERHHACAKTRAIERDRQAVAAPAGTRPEIYVRRARGADDADQEIAAERPQTHYLRHAQRKVGERYRLAGRVEPPWIDGVPRRKAILGGLRSLSCLVRQPQKFTDCGDRQDLG